MRQRNGLAPEADPAASRPAVPAREESGEQLEIVVVFTSTGPTKGALKQAGQLAHSLGARIKLVVPQIVSYQLPLESPPVLLDFTEREFRRIARETDEEKCVQIYLCRDRVEALRSMLPARSIVILGSRKRWWPTWEAKLARTLRRAGHEVILSGQE